MPVDSEKLQSKRWSVVAVAVLLVAAGVYFFMPGQKPAEPAGPSTKQRDVIGKFEPTAEQRKELNIKPVTLANFRTERVAEGRIAINDYRTTPVLSPYSGRVTRLFAEPGNVVKEGAPLFALQAAEFVQAQNDLTTAINGLNKAQAQYRLTKYNEERQRDLYAAKAASKRDYEQAQADFIAATNDLKSAEIAIDAVRNRLRILGKTPEEIDDLVNKAARINPEVLVQSPIAGTVILRKVGLGQNIQAGGSDPIFTIGDLSTVWLVANVRESDAPYIKTGQTVEVRVLAYPGKVYTAKVIYIAPTIDPITRRLTVRAEFSNEDFALKPEMFASFTIASDDATASPAVPASAIVFEGATARVWVVEKDGGIISREIAVGRATADRVEVKSGLSAGEDIVTAGALFIDRAAPQAETRGDKG